MKRFLRIISIVTLITACGNSKPTTPAKAPEAAAPASQKPVQPLVLKAGVLEAKIPCSGDPSLSIAVYTPSGYLPPAKAPVLILFDPHGDGSYPLTLYKSLADRYGYVLVGSNDSKNGNAKEITAHLIDEIIATVHQLLPSDSQRIYAGGFSGGGRVAAMMALSPAGIQGLVTCGAGFPANMWTGAPPTVVIGMAGNKDPNLNEVVNFNPTDQRLISRYQLIRTDAKHEWPSLPDFEKVFFAFETFAIRDHLPLAVKAKPLVEKITSTFERDYNQHMSKGQYLAAAGDDEAIIKELEGLEDPMMGAKQRYSLLLGDKRYTKALADDKSLFAEEQQRTQLFMQAFGKMDTSWWRQQMSDLYKEVKANPNAARSDMLIRVTGNLSLGCYMNLSKTLAEGNNETNRYISVVYRYVDPDNPEAWYIAATIAARDQKNDEAFSYLKKAAEKGFHDKDRLLADPAFSALQSNTSFTQLINQLKK